MNARWLDEATLNADAWFARLMTRFDMEWEGDRYAEREIQPTPGGGGPGDLPDPDTSAEALYPDGSAPL